MRIGVDGRALRASRHPRGVAVYLKRLLEELAALNPNDEYRVTAEAGETIREVARKALGDAGSWKKLYQLNPDIDPTLPLPAGTTVRLR